MDFRVFFRVHVSVGAYPLHVCKGGRGVLREEGGRRARAALALNSIWCCVAGGCEVHLLDGEQLEAVMRSYAPSESDFGAPSEASTTLEELLAAGGHHPGHKSAVALLQELRGHMRPTGSASGHVAQEVPSNM
jgi:hypothetical protein